MTRDRLRHARLLAACAVMATMLSACSSIGHGVSSSPPGRDSASAAAAPPAPTADSWPGTETTTPTSLPATQAHTATEPSRIGCGANDIPVPKNADTSSIPDVDHDGRDDLQFFVEGHRFAYGIHTASGATIILDDDLAGPGRHHGWTSVREQGVITVLDDSRNATVHALINCQFVTTLDPLGKPFEFSLRGNDGTGIRCTSSNGGLLLYGVTARQGDDGGYDIVGQQIIISEKGRRARLDAREITFASDVAASDPEVDAAEKSLCGSLPRVQTSGR